MSYEIPGFKLGVLVAGESLAAKQYHFVKINSSGAIVACSAITDRPIGILQNAPASGAECEIMVSGVSKLVADGTIDEGNAIGTSADGQGDAIAPGTDTTVYNVGQALESAAAGELFAVLFNCANAGRAT